MEDAGTANRILRKAREMFFARGFVHVTMDELAYELGMSKRTVYEHFPSKKALLRKALLQQVEIITTGLMAITEEQVDPIGKLRRVLPFMSEALPRPSRQFLLDMQRSTPELWEELDHYRSRSIERFFRSLLTDGQARGFFRSDIDPDLFLLLLNTLIQRAVSPEVLSKVPFTAAQVFRGIMSVLTGGILTDEGRRCFQEN